MVVHWFARPDLSHKFRCLLALYSKMRPLFYLLGNDEYERSFVVPAVAVCFAGCFGGGVGSVEQALGVGSYCVFKIS